MIFLAIAALWCATGYGCFVYWWTSQNDLETGDALFGLLPAMMGPLAWFVGKSIHGGGPPSRVLIRARGTRIQ